MECLKEHNGSILIGVFPKSFRAACCGSGLPGDTSIFGNSHRCALTNPAGRCLTSKRPRCEATNEMKWRRVTRAEKRESGNRYTRPSSRATHRPISVHVGQH